MVQQKGRPIPIHLQPAVGKEIEKLTKNGHIEKATDIDENCFVSPAVITVKKDKTIKIAKDTNAEYGGVNIQNIQKNRRRRGRRDMDIKIRLGLRIRSTTVIKTRQGSMHICGNRRELHRLLQIPQGLVRLRGHPDHIPRKNRPNTGKQTPGVVR